MTAYAALKSRLAAGEAVILDGPTGTELQRRGARMDPAAWCGPATLANDRLLIDIHADYITAGAEIVTANTFAASGLMLGAAGLADRAEEIVTRAVAAALAARERAGVPGVVVAGSLSHMMPMASGSAVLDPRLLPSEGAMSEAFHVLARQLRDSGCELILLEMMYHPMRARLALAAALATGLPVWFGLSARRTRAGGVASFHAFDEIGLADIAALIPATGVDAAGVMHTDASIIGAALAVVRRHFAGPLMAYPDSGYFEMPDWQFVDVIGPERFGAFCAEWLAAGAQLIGGCCGLTPSHIRAATRARDAARAGGGGTATARGGGTI